MDIIGFLVSLYKHVRDDKRNTYLSEEYHNDNGDYRKKKKHCNRRIGTKLGKGYDNDIQCNGEILVIRNEISLQFQYHYLQWPIIAIMFTAV